MVADWLVIGPDALPPVSFLGKELLAMAEAAGRFHISYREEFVPKNRIELVIRRKGAWIQRRIRLYVCECLVDEPALLVQKLQDLSAVTSRYALLRRCKALGKKLNRLTRQYKTIWKNEKRKIPHQGFELALYLFSLERNQMFLGPDLLPLVLSEVSAYGLLAEVLYEKGVVSLGQYLQAKPLREEPTKPAPFGVKALKRLQALPESGGEKVYYVFDVFIV